MKLSSLFLLLPVLFWGISYIAIKVVLRELEPVEMISARFLLAAPTLFIIIKAKRLKIWPVQKKGGLFVASFLVFLHFWVMATGMKETTASNTAWILTTAPIFVAALAWVYLREPFSKHHWIGFIVATFGVVVLTANGSWSNLAWINSRGDVIVLGSCVTWGLYTVATRDITRTVNPLVATFWMTLVAGLVFVPYTLFTSGIGIYLSMQPVTTLSLVFLGVLCLAVSFWLWAEGLSRFTAADVGAYLYIEPLFTMVAAWALLNEAVTVWILTGAAFITMGVYISERKGKVKLVEHDV